jgi:hypothetical protein
MQITKFSIGGENARDQNGAWSNLEFQNRTFTSAIKTKQFLKKKKRQQAHDTSRVIWYSLRNIAIVHSHKIDSFVCRYKLFGCLWRAS